MRPLPLRLFRALPLLLLLAAPAAPAARAQQPRVMNAAEISLAIRKLGVAGSALYVAAHPDDENTALLSYLAGGRGVRTAYLSVTRGDGGQNLIGAEKGEMLGLLRTQELLAARRIDGAEQYFTRAVDFGYTKSAAEALKVWGHEEVLSDVVWVVRSFRPDVIITRFPAAGEGGHGQHAASAVLAREAFEAAGDPSRFPEQLAHVRPWRPKRLLWNVFRFQPGERLIEGGRLVSVDLGAYNPLLGESYTEVAARSRSQHKSQGFGAAGRRGPSVNYLAHLAGEEAAGDLFDGVDLTWSRFPGGAEVGRLLERAAREYRASEPQAVLPLLVGAHAEMSRLPGGDPLIEARRRDLLEAIRAAAGLWIEAVAAEPSASAGGSLKLTVTLVNRSDFPLRLERVEPPYAEPHPPNAELQNNRPVGVETILRVPADAEPGQPYWLREPHGEGLFAVADVRLIGMPERPAVPPVRVTVSAGAAGERLVFEVPLLYRRTDRVRGEIYDPVAVVPRVAVSLEEKVVVFPDPGPKLVRVRARSNAEGGARGALRLRLPEGWSAKPSEVKAVLGGRGEEFGAEFTVTPAADARSGDLAAEFVSADGTHARGAVEIDYAHVPRQVVFPAAEARLVRVDLKKRGSVIGYVMGSGDEVPEALRQVGYEVSLLTDEDLAAADLSRFDAVVTGVRAYNTRAALRSAQGRLLEYVARGGTLVVQYNTDDRTLEGVGLGPYPLKLSAQRVTDERAEVKILTPGDPLLGAPNRITRADFDGWVQERGLYFPGGWDARYRPLFAAADPGEEERRGLTLVARHGRGHYVYTPLAWFRQLPAGVPGAYRVFVNLVSAGAAE